MTPIHSKIKSITTNTCPKCHQGAFFQANNAYNLSKFDKMNSQCSVCHEDFERETGFYYGAMYVSYGLTVGFGLILFVITHFLLHINDLDFIWIFPIVIILLTPLFYRYARLLWINLFVSYDPAASKVN